MLYHIVKLIAKIDPLKYFLNKSSLIDILVKQVMVLSKFNVDYVDHKAIKGLVIID